MHLRLYMHDIVGGPGQTSMVIVKGPGPANPSMAPGNHFGDTVAIDDVLTDGPSLVSSSSSRAVGRAQGTYMLGSLERPVFVVAMTVVCSRRGPTTAARSWWPAATTPPRKSGSSPWSAGPGCSAAPPGTCSGRRPESSPRCTPCWSLTCTRPGAARDGWVTCF